MIDCSMAFWPFVDEATRDTFSITPRIEVAQRYYMLATPSGLVEVRA